VAHRLFSRSGTSKARGAASRLGTPPTPREPRHTSGVRENNRTGRDEDASFFRSLNALSALTDVSLAAEIALDVALYELLQQACTAALATSGAIGLCECGEIVCRARTGESAPDLGVRLDQHSMLAAACFENRNCQRCDDTETDPRVDAERCRRLGMRSILLVPILRAQEMIGILEVLSPLPNAFSDKETEVLRLFSQRVIEKLERAQQVQASGDLDSVREPGKLESWEPATQADSPDEEDAAGKSRKRDFSTDALLVSLVLLAVTLGWMLDRAEWHAHRGSAGKSRAQLSKGLSSAGSSSDSAAGTDPFADITLESKATDKDDNGDGSLVVSREGKVIFRLPAGENPAQSQVLGDQIQPATEKEVTTPRSVSPNVAEEHLVSRVEPVYPQAARIKGTQGPVVLDVWVGRDGAVNKLAPISGNPQLVAAATAAVQQWRFRPLFYEGQPEDFRTRITVTFRLP
jgi:TonB family protein